MMMIVIMLVLAMIKSSGKPHVIIKVSSTLFKVALMKNRKHIPKPSSSTVRGGEGEGSGGYMLFYYMRGRGARHRCYSGGLAF